MTGLARDDEGIGQARQAERLLRALSHFFGWSLVVGPILFGIWFASTAIEKVKPLDPLPPPKIAPLPKLPIESDALPQSDAEAGKVTLATGRMIERQVH